MPAKQWRLVFPASLLAPGLAVLDGQPAAREDVPVSIGLIVDNSGSMRTQRSSLEAAALALVRNSHPEDEVFVVNFTDRVYFDMPHGKDFLTDREEIKLALERIDQFGGSAMRDAVQKSIDWMEKAHKQKHVLVLLTDGVDNASYLKLEDLLRSAQQSGVVIYALGLLDEDKRIAAEARRLLNSMAEATVAREIRSQHTIACQPSNQSLDGSYRKIKITLRPPGNPKARTRTGYFATPDQGAPAAPVRAGDFRR